MDEVIDPRVLKVMEVSKQQPLQRDPEWHKKRYHFLTASEIASTVKLIQHEIDLRDNGIVELPPKKKVGQTVPAYNNYAALMRNKCKPQSSESSLPAMIEMEWGVAYEHIVTELHQSFLGTTIHAFNLIPHPTIDFLAASPDGISSDGRMVEIKCPYRRIPTGMPKIQYWMQMQLQMECCDMEVCDFLDIVIKEYGNREAYISDIYGESEDDPEFVYTRNAAGLPKGIMIERNITDHITGVIKRKYYYPPVLHFTNQQEETEWLENWATEIYKEIGESSPRRVLDLLTSQSETYQIRYWYIEQWHSVPVYRDRLWFNTRLPEFKQFWDLVIKYRREGVPENLEKAIVDDDEVAFVPKRNNSRVAPVNINPNEGCLFSADDE